MFCRCVLRQPQRSRKKSSFKSINEFTNKLLDQWMDEKYVDLFTQCCEHSRNRSSKKRVFAPNGDKAKHLIRLNRFSDAVKALSFKGFAASSDDNIATLESKHPHSGPLPENIDEILEDALPLEDQVLLSSITTEDILNSLKSFPNGTACSKSLLSHHMLLRSCTISTHPAVSEELLKSIRELFKAIFQGRMHPNCRKFFFGANLIALTKKDGGIRPIAIGEILRRLLGKVVLNKLNVRLDKQFGVKRKGGMEIVCHSVKKDLSASPDLVVLKLDFKNAFNSINRPAMLKIVEKVAPSIYNLVALSYNRESLLLFEDNTLWSREGVQQGDPLGPLLFCLTLQPLIVKLQALLGHIDSFHQYWYLDDGTIVADRQSAMEALNIVHNYGCGLELNLSKCEIYGIGNLDMFPREIKRVRSLELLGVPLTDEAEFLDKKIVKFKQDLVVLNSLDDCQCATLLLKYCLSASHKINHILRIAPPDAIDSQLTEIEEIMTETFERIIQESLPSSSITQLALKPSSGGVGLQLARAISHTAYLGSLALVSSETGLNFSDPVVLHQFNTIWDLNATVEPGNQVQKSLSAELDAVQSARFKNSLSPTECKWIESCSHNSQWFCGVPNSKKGTVMSSQHFRYAMLQRLRIPLFGDKVVCRSLDDSKRCLSIDKFGFHAIGCPKGGATHWRHGAVQRIVYEEAKAGLLNPLLDPIHLVESSKRPADIYVPDWSNRIPLAMDVSIVVPTRTTPLPSAGIAELAHQAKIKKHREDCRKAGIRFEPIIFEAGGFIHPNSAKILEDLSSRRAIREGKEPKAVYKRLLHKISVCIQTGNAKGILNHANHVRSQQGWGEDDESYPVDFDVNLSGGG